MRFFLRATFGLCLALAGIAQAQTQTQGTSRPAVVVEFYTSQGCSSCPPADEFFAELAKDPGIIPLALHVDYWDYIGWADKFADPRHTERQKAYARKAGSTMIYTPQLIVGGLDAVEGSQPAQVAMLIRRHMDVDHNVSLTLERDGNAILIRASAEQAFDQPVQVQLVRYVPEERVDIHRGENAGRTVTYHNIVTSWQVIGEWTGAIPLALSARASGKEPAVVILQHEGPGAIVAAAQIP
jgi:hypothetical protein